MNQESFIAIIIYFLLYELLNCYSVLFLLEFLLNIF